MNSEYADDERVIRLSRRLGLAAHAAVAARLPLAAEALIAAVAASVAAFIVVVQPDGVARDVGALVLLALLGMAAERFDINLYEDSRLSLSAVFLVTAAIALGPGAVAVAGVAVALAGHAGRGRAFYKLLFNISTFVAAGLASAYVYRAMGAAAPEGRIFDAGSAILAAGANFAVASVLVTLAVAASGGGTVRAIWAEKFAWLLPHFVLMGFLAFILTMAYGAFGLYGILGFVAPVLMQRFTMKQYVDRTGHTVRELREKNDRISELRTEVEEAYSETLDAFVSALDLRDTETHGHSTRVAELSLRIGEMLGVRAGPEWFDLKHGAMLHDVGKIGVPDAILRKRGTLDEQDWEAIRQHPAHGYNMLKNVRFLAGAAELVLCHHERYDGKGYPRGLRGEEIPLAARIFAVADTFDAITSTRPYKPSFSVAHACREINAHRGTQFDPRAVDALLLLYGHGADTADIADAA